MLSDQIASITSAILGNGWGYGFGMAVLRDPVAAASPLNVGSVRWGGGYGHTWWIDETARISAVLCTNTAFEGMAGKLRDDFQRAVYGVSRAIARDDESRAHMPSKYAQRVDAPPPAKPMT